MWNNDTTPAIVIIETTEDFGGGDVDVATRAFDDHAKAETFVGRATARGMSVRAIDTCTDHGRAMTAAILLAGRHYAHCDECTAQSQAAAARRKVERARAASESVRRNCAARARF